MKRILLTILAIIIFVSPCAFAAANVTTVSDFEIRFAAASLANESGHYLNASIDNRSAGEVNDIIQAIFNDSEMLQLSITHGTDNVVSALAMYMPDGDSNHVADYILLISELLYATGITSTTTDTGDVLNRLGFFDNLDDGTSKKIVVNGLNVGYMVSSTVGIWFYVEA